MYQSINPATGELLAEFPEASDAEARAAVDRAAAAYPLWKRAPLAERVALLRAVARLHRERADELAAITTRETGKPVAQSLGELGIVADIYDYYAEHAAEFLADEVLPVDGPGTAIVRTEPLGVLIGVMPWNFPHYQVARFAAPNLALGNTIVLKHARNCPQSALAIERLLADAGAPDGVYVNVFATAGQVADLIADPRVQGVSLTGSERAGSAVGEVAGRHMKKAVLELGGSDPLIVLADADLDRAATDAASSRMSNAGQTCTAAKRMIVVDAVYDAFVERFVRRMEEYTAGDPLDGSTRLGPLATTGARDEVAELVADAVRRGATVRTGGALPDGPGAYYPPTVLTGVTPGMRAFGEEIFGPVAVVYRVGSADEAVELANASAYGLAGSVYSGDARRARAVADSLEVGMTAINSLTVSSPELPFGGVKRSGIGRELSRYGMSEFANKKLVRDPAA